MLKLRIPIAQNGRRRYRLVKIPLAIIASLFVVFGLLYFAFLSAPGAFPSSSYFKVDRGSTVSQIAGKLYQRSIIRSPAVFKLIVRLFKGDSKIVSGYYHLGQTDSVIAIARKLIKGEFGYTPFRVTVTEGMSNKDIAEVLTKTFPHFDKTSFLSQASSSEGFLFPDTYFFAPTETTADIIGEMKDNYERKVADLQSEIAASGRSEKDIIIVASLIEKETRTSTDRRLVSGIIWKRLAFHMPLQIDAVFQYIMNKNTFEVSKSDLRNNSPYNTYLYKGLPPGPIANPGLDSIKAALEPTPSSYWYYLSDMKGTLHYAESYAQQEKNKTKYLSQT